MNARAWKRVWWQTRAGARAGVRCRCAGRVAGGALLLLVGAALLPPAPAPLTTTARYPHVAPRTLAHKLADFSTHLLLYPHLGEWSVEEESGNYTAWHYAVSYTCGARCSGRARVLALDRHAHDAPAHDAPPEHRVLVAHRACTRLPLLPWPEFCDEWETESVIVSDGARGSVLRETARASCAALRRLLPPLPASAPAPASCAARLRDHREQHFQRLRVLLAAVRAR